MKQHHSLDHLPDAARSVTIGKFDGIHLGHQALIRQTVAVASEKHSRSCVVTFDRPPNAVLQPETVKSRLIGNTQKTELIQALGVDELIELHFDEALAAEAADEFVERVLVNALQATNVVVGPDFRFGKGGAGDVELLELLGSKFGFEVHVVAPVAIDGQVVSSSRIRELLDAGEVVEAGELLGRVHATRGEIEHGLKIGRKIGFPTANMARDCEGYLPLDAVYAGWLVDGDQRYPAALSVGINETFQAVPRLVEAHVLDRTDLDLYGHIVTLEYVAFIRATAKFNGVEDLVEQINRDLDDVRAVLGV